MFLKLRPGQIWSINITKSIMQKIMFNDKYGLTQAVLNGRKTQTRRFVPREFFTLQWDERGDTLVVENEYGEFIDIRDTKFCLCKVGEIVAIAQSYKDIFSAFSQHHNPQLNICVKNPTDTAGWNNKMFVKAEVMPHQIRITKVRIEKLQDISDEDCLAEGIEFNCNAQSYYVDYHKETGYMLWLGPTAREAYAALIDKISRKAIWESNPYVFVYEFELIK